MVGVGVLVGGAGVVGADVGCGIMLKFSVGEGVVAELGAAVGGNVIVSLDELPPADEADEERPLEGVLLGVGEVEEGIVPDVVMYASKQFE